jgi:hypothetical protein
LNPEQEAHVGAVEAKDMDGPPPLWGDAPTGSDLEIPTPLPIETEIIIDGAEVIIDGVTPALPEESENNLFSELPAKESIFEPILAENSTDGETLIFENEPSVEDGIKKNEPFSEIPIPWSEDESEESVESGSKAAAAKGAAPLPWAKTPNSESSSLFGSSSPFDSSSHDVPPTFTGGNKKKYHEEKEEVEVISDPFASYQSPSEDSTDSPPPLNSDSKKKAPSFPQKLFASLGKKKPGAKRLSNTIIILLLIVVGTTSGASIAAFFVPLDSFGGKAKVYVSDKAPNEVAGKVQ